MNKIAIFFIKIYQKTLSPTKGLFRALYSGKQFCVYYPTCSEYGVTCYEKYNFFKATRKTAARIWRCHPGATPRVDLP